jgi:hypothetical protein
VCSVLQYTITPSYPSTPFAIRTVYSAASQQTWGQIYLVPGQSLNYFASSAHYTTVTVRDSSGLTATGQIVVSVLLVNRPPTMGNYSFSVTEGVALGSTVGSITASDRESDTLTYSIDGGNSLGIFFLQPPNTIKVATAVRPRPPHKVRPTTLSPHAKCCHGLQVDYEAYRSHTLRVKAQETSTTEKYSAISYVTVSVLDVNDLTITVITASGGLTYSTRGGTAVYIQGTNMGPVVAAASTNFSASYTTTSGGLVTYAATGCTLTVGHPTPSPGEWLALHLLP